MKSFKKQCITTIFLLIGIFFIGIDKVHATWLDTRYYTLQCIYADGGLYTRALNFGKSDLSQNSKNWHYTQNRILYNLVGAPEQDSTSSSSMVFVNAMRQDLTTAKDDYVQFYTCRKYVRAGVYKDDNGSTMYFKFMHAANYGFSDEELGAKSSWFSWLGVQTDSEKKAEAINKSSEAYELVSDSIVLKSNAPAPNNTYYYVQKATQASGSDKYIKILTYDNVVLIQSEDHIAQVRYGEGAGVFIDLVNGKFKKQDEVPQHIYINSPEPMISTEGSAIKYSYNKGQPRYLVSEEKGDYKGMTINHYELTLEPEINLNADTGELCKTIMPNTAVQLRKIIKITQILIPVLLIVLIGFDFGKIVMSGNLDEELPKQKKRIIRRLIVAITFFFLPIIVTLIINIMKTTGDARSGTIELIGCLFK